ncbi:MAG: protoheme IX farnesyltransferase [Anaerolineae bacterium]|nr:protoheme IX farnesyltransferase [Anaerolineae bacterium]
MAVEAPAAPETRLTWRTLRETYRTLLTLFKTRIVFLLLMAALGGAFLGAHGVPAPGDLVTILLTGALAAGGASAINQYLERHSDSRMTRTEKRPMVNGQIRHPHLVLAVAGGMIAVAVLAVLPGNPVMALYLLLGALIYVGVYTIWLKPRSVLNIVIGGAAGSCAVLTGGAAVGAASDPGVIALAGLLFLWTPAHFWALAMFHKDDYTATATPMLPVLISPPQTAWWIFIHALSTGLAAIILAVHPMLGLLYLVPAGAFTLAMLIGGVRLIRKPTRKHAISLFVTTNIFLLAVFVIIMVATVSNQFLF